jgi:anti-sigma regulatory factor (Ser/Thr protein kinase)
MSGFGVVLNPHAGQNRGLPDRLARLAAIVGDEGVVRAPASYAELDEVVIELRDRGPKFDPTQAPVLEPDASDHRPPGGWGIQLVRRYTDEIRYLRDGDENVLRLTRKLGTPTGQQ